MNAPRYDRIILAIRSLRDPVEHFIDAQARRSVEILGRRPSTQRRIFK